MDLSKLSAGIDPPNDLNVVIEIPQGSSQPVKYEFDKASGALLVDRFLHTAMFYPANYGFVPHTLSADGDPIDVLVICQAAVVPGSVIRSRPIGTLMLEDEHGGDEKIVAVPVDALHPYYTDVREPEDLRQVLGHWVGADEARALVTAAIERARSDVPC